MKRVSLPFADIWLAAAILLMIAGCVAANHQNGHSLVLKTSVQYGCVKYLSSHPEHIGRAETLVNDVAAALDSDTAVTLNEIELLVIESISWNNLAPEDRLVLSALLYEIKYQVGMQIGEGRLDEADKVFARQFLGWIRQAVQMSKV